MKQRFIVSFEENGGEYYGELIITTDKLEQLTKSSFKADGVLVEIDENIVSIKVEMKVEQPVDNSSCKLLNKKV